MEAGHRSSIERLHGRFESLAGGKAAPRTSLLGQSEYRKVAKKRKMKSLTPSGRRRLLPLSLPPCAELGLGAPGTIPPHPSSRWPQLASLRPSSRPQRLLPPSRERRAPARPSCTRTSRGAASPCSKIAPQTVNALSFQPHDCKNTPDFSSSCRSHLPPPNHSPMHTASSSLTPHPLARPKGASFLSGKSEFL
jgi:hypothetical protein